MGDVGCRLTRTQECISLMEDCLSNCRSFCVRPEIFVCRWLLPHGVLESDQKDTDEITKEPTLKALNQLPCRHCLPMSPAKIPTETYTSPYELGSGGGSYSP